MAGLDRAAALTLCLVGLACLPAEAQSRRGRTPPKPNGGDKVEPSRGTIVTERSEIAGALIKEEKFAGIKYATDRRGRDEKTIRGEDVLEIRFDDAPPEFMSGMSQLRSGRYDRAAESFAAARKAPLAWVEAHCTLYVGDAKRLAEDYAGAIPEYEKLLKADADHFLAPAAIYGLGLAQAGDGKLSAALDTFKKLDRGFGDRWRVKGKIGEGNAYLAQKKFTEALTAFGIARDQAGRGPLRSEAVVGMGSAYVLSKQYEKANKLFDDLLRDTTLDPEVAGAAWAGRGDIRYAEAEQENMDKNALKKALIAYQTCATQFAGVSAYAKALYMSAQIYRRLGMEKLAGFMEQELLDSRPGSPWAKKLKR
ncbi:MAG: tetratricopeptide repeat protein [Planctomycetes bacterium]|nr:tetratricopeptide repeat protein [Planctomycetota bacterium]